MKLLVYTEKASPRLTYILDTVLQQWYGIGYVLVHHPAEAAAYQGPVLQYTKQRRWADRPWLPAHPLLWQHGSASIDVNVAEADGYPLLFPAQAGDWPGDMLAQAFYLLTRYEEYQPFDADQHGRFAASSSLAHRHGFLEVPIADYWLNRLVTDLVQHYPALTYEQPTYTFEPTYDIDLPWAYRYRGWRGVAAGVRDALTGQTGRLHERWRVSTGRQNDPYNVFARLADWHEQYQLHPRYFWLVADRGHFDTNPSATLPAVRRLIRRTAERYPVGIHPSYAAYDDPARLVQEIRRLGDITGQPVIHSRQHYLRLRFPDTYRQLLAAGVRHDYTLGYADRAGFRASTARSFRWYDLAAETATELWVHPFAVMDVTLRQYERLTPACAEKRITQLVETVRQHGGTFRPLWHNSSFAEQFGWMGWYEVYERLLQAAAG